MVAPWSGEAFKVHMQHITHVNCLRAERGGLSENLDVTQSRKKVTRQGSGNTLLSNLSFLSADAEVHMYMC